MLASALASPGWRQEVGDLSRIEALLLRIVRFRGGGAKAGSVPASSTDPPRCSGKQLRFYPFHTNCNRPF